jgi:AraC family transcriptional regulator
MSVNRLEYEKRVNRVIDHIRGHLTHELLLVSLARVATFSPFHFHRVFKAVTTETLFAFIQRLRIEKAAGALTTHPDLSVLEVALDHGFSSSATFARAFKAHFGMSATEWRDGGAQRWRARRQPERNPSKQVRNPGKASPRVRADTAPRLEEGRRMNVHVREFPAYRVAYMRYVGPYGARGIPELWARFGKWLAAHDLGPGGRITLGVGYDDAAITAADKCRYDACVVVSDGFQPDRWVNVMDLPGGKCAVGQFQGTAHDITTVWDRVFSSWLPNSGYQPDDRPCFELYRGDPTVGAKAGTFRCELCLPVRPL